MTFKNAQTIIDCLPAGSERGEFSQLLTIVERAISAAKSKDIDTMRQNLQSAALVAQELAAIGEIEMLVPTVNKRAKLPKGFWLWSTKMQLGWLKQNQA